MYIVCLNASFGLIGGAIKSGIFLKDAANVIILPYDEALANSTKQLLTSLSGINLDVALSSPADFFNTAFSLQQVIVNSISALFLFIGNVITFVPSMMISFGAPPELMMIIEGLLALTTAIAMFQLISGKWLPFAE